MMRWLFLVICLIWTALLFAGHTVFAADPRVTNETADPLVYCARAGTMDVPKTDNSHPGEYWRCMDGAVYVCTVGANIPCDVKADRAKHNVGADSYCRENRDAATVPAYATGHRTIYEWHCAAGIAVRGGPIAKLDRRGFRVDIWQRVSR